METDKEKIIITAALPYANGQIHIGHLLEYIQADIYSRFLKLLKKDALYICASDMHGTPIEINAKKAGKDPKVFAEENLAEHKKDFASYLINFDNYSHTDSEENKELAEYFFDELKKKDLIYRKKMEVIYCESCKRSLPDRYVKGICPHCKKDSQYGDICEGCNTTLKGVDLLEPKCTLCNSDPIQKESEHYFFKLSNFSKELQEWISNEDSCLQPEVKNWLNNWIGSGLEDWCVSRDAPYFGFEIPNSEEETGEKKYFYVWLDAPIGYISSTKNLLKDDWETYWKQGQVYHFLGKDISYFHFLFWPAMLMGVGIPLPKLTVHGFITINGQKMSKSRGTFFTAKDFLKMYSAESLRFYYAQSLDRKITDVDLSFEDFQAVVNNVLMGNLGNFCYRTLVFAEKNYGEIEHIAEEKELEEKINVLIENIKNYYLQQNFKLAVKEILKIADLGNIYFQNSEAWKDKDSEESKSKVGFCVNLARNLSILVSPILPVFSKKIFAALGETELTWENLGFDWKGKVSKVELLVDKIDKLPGDDLFPIRMVVGQIKEVNDHPNADSLYLMKVDLGKELGIKQVIAGLKKYFSKEDLSGKKAVFCANLKPAKLRGEMSEAMIFAAEDKEKNISLLNVEETEVGEDVNFGDLKNNPAEISFDELSKVKIVVKENRVYCNNKKLSSCVEDIKTENVNDGGKVR